MQRVNWDDGTYLVKYKWHNPMRKKQDDGITSALRTVKDGVLNLFQGATILDYKPLEEVWGDENRVDIVGQNGNNGEHYENAESTQCSKHYDNQ